MAPSAVSKRPLRSWLLSALGCWLTLLASADDFNLARFALPPSTADSEESLPLDDPNTDFTESSPSPGPSGTRGRGAPASSAGPGRAAGAAGQYAASALASPFDARAYGRPSLPHHNTPLRC
jgi:hypothetical protein